MTHKKYVKSMKDSHERSISDAIEDYEKYFGRKPECIVMGLYGFWGELRNQAGAKSTSDSCWYREIEVIFSEYMNTNGEVLSYMAYNEFALSSLMDCTIHYPKLIELSDRNRVLRTDNPLTKSQRTQWGK